MSDEFIPRDEVERHAWNLLRAVPKKVRKQYAAQIKGDLELRRKLLADEPLGISESMYLAHLVGKYQRRHGAE